MVAYYISTVNMFGQRHTYSHKNSKIWQYVKRHVHKHGRHKRNAHTVAANSFFSICQINLKCILKSSTMRFILHRKVILGTHLKERHINSNILTSSFQRLFISIKQTFGRNVTLSHNFMPQIYQWNDNRPTCF